MVTTQNAGDDAEKVDLIDLLMVQLLWKNTPAVSLKS